MKNITLYTLLLLSIQVVGAQDGVGIGTTSVDPDAILDISSNSKGVYVPRVTTAERLTISPESDTAPPNSGLLVFDTNENAFYYHNGTRWSRMIEDSYPANPSGNGPVPQGGIIMWSGATAPSGWAICDGTNGTPDLSGRFIVGYDADALSTPTNTTSKILNYGAPGNTGGANNHVLTTSEMPSHDHTATSNTTGDHIHKTSLIWEGNTTYASQDLTSSGRMSANPASSYRLKQENRSAGAVWAGQTSQEGGHSHTITVNSRGSDTAHENRPAYYVLAFIMKL